MIKRQLSLYIMSRVADVTKAAIDCAARVEDTEIPVEQVLALRDFNLTVMSARLDIELATADVARPADPPSPNR